MTIHFFRPGIESDLAALEEVHRLLESHLQDARNIAASLLSKTPTVPGDADEDEVGQILAEHAESAWLHDRRFDVELPRFIRYGLITTTYGYFETNAKRVCAEIDRRKKLNLKLRLKLPGNHNPAFTEALADFLTKPGVLSVGAESGALISPMEDLRVVRNCIVHVGGDLINRKNSDRQAIQRIISSDIGVRLMPRGRTTDPDELDHLWLEEKYCTRVLGDLRNFFQRLFDAAACFE